MIIYYEFDGLYIMNLMDYIDDVNFIISIYLYLWLDISRAIMMCLSCKKDRIEYIIQIYNKSKGRE